MTTTHRHLARRDAFVPTTGDPREVAPPCRDWPTAPTRATRADRNGVILYAPAWDGVICVPCQREAGPGGRAELGAGVRPATTVDLRRLPLCTSCGRDLSALLRGAA